MSESTSAVFVLILGTLSGCSVMLISIEVTQNFWELLTVCFVAYLKGTLCAVSCMFTLFVAELWSGH